MSNTFATMEYLYVFTKLTLAAVDVYIRLKKALDTAVFFSAPTYTQSHYLFR